MRSINAKCSTSSWVEKSKLPVQSLRVGCERGLGVNAGGGGHRDGVMAVWGWCDGGMGMV